MVIDVTNYVHNHPGGQFVLQQNIGRDISKFFYGGYSLEDNMGSSPARGYTHSNYAKLVVQDLVKGVYEK